MPTRTSDVSQMRLQVHALLPLRPVVFAILSLLRQRALHGYGIMQAVNQHLGRRAVLGPGTLYRTLKELRELGLIRHSDPDPAEDARRHYYRLTELGRRTAEAEANRLAGLMRSADLADPVASR